ncbi:hypothetical protein O1611_g8622 [Lasiodiplodia mahajangana]|uniref:Uncharacterized protein n=1 Tax=Lasiodiplodia mahajangana TaxID=1108764 RepID=A0ACC2JCE5_9PEZI|nr:hypothetical protein O1611_g8622 [Lasiodiplodia mahajangana]
MRLPKQFFKSVPSATSGAPLASKASTYYGGEQRTSHSGGNALVLAFPGSSFGTFKPEIAVLTALLGGQPNVKWSPGFSVLSKATSGSFGLSASASNLTYSDAGLLAIQISGAAPSVRKTAEEAVNALKSIAAGKIIKEDLAKAVAKAKFDALDASQSGVSTLLSAGSGIVQTGKPFQVVETVQSINSVTADKLTAAAKALLDGKATVAAVGDLHVLPYAEELGLKELNYALPGFTGLQLVAEERLPTPTSVRTKWGNFGARAPSLPSGCPSSELGLCQWSIGAVHTCSVKLRPDFASIEHRNNPPVQPPQHKPQPTVKMTFAWKAAGLTYNRYLAVASRVVRRSLQENKRVAAERRGEMDLRFAKWENGKMGETKNLADANAAAAVESAATGGTA